MTFDRLLFGCLPLVCVSGAVIAGWGSLAVLEGRARQDLPPASPCRPGPSSC